MTTNNRGVKINAAANIATINTKDAKYLWQIFRIETSKCIVVNVINY